MKIPISALFRLPRLSCARAAFLVVHAAAALAMGGCTTKGASDGVLWRGEQFVEMWDVGMAMTPVGHLDPVADAAEVSALLTNEVYANLFIDSPSLRVVQPQDVLASLKEAGEVHLERFRRVRRILARDEKASPEDLRGLGNVIGHRFLLIAWVDEQLDTGLETGAGSYTDAGFARDVERTTYDKIEGRIEGVILDLQLAETVWRGAQDYRTARLYGDKSQIDKETDRARIEAAARFAALFSQP